jgi:hypothetical protein
MWLSVRHKIGRISSRVPGEPNREPTRSGKPAASRNVVPSAALSCLPCCQRAILQRADRIWLFLSGSTAVSPGRTDYLFGTPSTLGVRHGEAPNVVAARRAVIVVALIPGPYYSCLIPVYFPFIQGAHTRQAWPGLRGQFWMAQPSPAQLEQQPGMNDRCRPSTTSCLGLDLPQRGQQARLIMHLFRPRSECAQRSRGHHGS